MPRRRAGTTLSAARGSASATTGATPSARSRRRKFPFTGARIIKVVYDVGKDGYVDVERMFRGEAGARLISVMLRRRRGFQNGRGEP
jgi:hypothetical protein